jgi:hypothetical protein
MSIAVVWKSCGQRRTEGGACGAKCPPASENFVFFWSKGRKNEIFLLDLAKKGVVPPALETSVRPCMRL